MTLREGKNRVYMLLDEHSSGGVTEHDPDMEAKMAAFFDTAQKRAAALRRIVKTANVRRESGAEDCAVPADFGALRRVWCGGRDVTRRCRWRGSRLLLPAGEQEAVVEYCAVPAALDGNTPEDYVFEVDEDAAQTLPFFVAAQQLAADPSGDGAGLMDTYLRLTAALERDVTGDALCARQTLYRG